MRRFSLVGLFVGIMFVSASVCFAQDSEAYVAGATSVGIGQERVDEVIERQRQRGAAVSELRQTGGYGALAIDRNQGNQWGWAVDHQTPDGAAQRARSECGGNCSIVMRFSGGQCGAYATDQERGSTIYGWGTASSSSGAQNRARSECRRRGGKSCLVRVWGCNSR